MTGRTLTAVALAVLVVSAGCASLPTGGDRAGSGDSDGDQLGRENGYSYDDDVSVTPADGYNESEREAVVARAMARLERIRGLEFNSTVPVSVVTREQYRANRSGGGSGTHEAWNDQVWEGLFIVGESTGTGETFDDTLGASVQGYYSPGREAVVVVSDSPTPSIERGTLVHELVHALQDQHFTLGASADTQDEQLAVDGVVEGEANYLQALYERRCGGEWRCVENPPAESADGSSDGGPDNFNEGLLLTIYQPYATGPSFVDHVRSDRGLLGDLLGESGWDAVDTLYSDFPDSTEQVIHPETYPDEGPVNVTVPDRSSEAWERYSDHDPVADTVGEASVYAMFVSNGVVDPQDRFGYRSEPSAGWGGDSLVPYRNNDTAPGEGAYVWQTTWDTEADARQFHDAYRDLLDRRDANNPRGNVYVVPDASAFGDAFRLTRDGKTVRVVNAPTPDGLDGVHAPPDEG